ncbi:MAG: DNA repair protein RadC [Chthoniobacterales bacterium]
MEDEDRGRIAEIPKGDRPREKLALRGAGSLTDAELLAIFLRTGIPGRNAIRVAGDLLKTTGGLGTLARCSIQEIGDAAKGIGPVKAAELAAVFEVGRRLARGGARKPKVDSPERVYDLLSPDFATLDRERVVVVVTNTRYEMVWQEVVSVGSVNESIAHPREILRPVIVRSGFGFLLVHNHPSGDPGPSEADRRLTTRINEAAELLKLRFLDHIIIGTADGGRDPYYSFREHGLL